MAEYFFVGLLTPRRQNELPPPSQQSLFIVITQPYGSWLWQATTPGRLVGHNICSLFGTYIDSSCSVDHVYRIGPTPRRSDEGKVSRSFFHVVRGVHRTCA